MLFQSTVVVALLASFTAAQSTANSTIDPNTITATMRSQWCQGQTNVCGTLCSGDVATNTCTPDTLNYTCTCAANNSMPGLQYYTNTMPTFICETIFANCIAASVGDAASQARCNANEKANCGHNDPSKFVAAAATTSAATTAAASTSAGATAAAGTGTAASSSSSQAAAATAAAKYFGTGALAVGLGAMGFLI